MFDPTVGRWLSEDPIGFEGSDVNLFRYVQNGPSNYSDPSGMAKIKVGGYVFYVHPNDPDNIPSDPHAHIGGPNTPVKVHIHTGEIYHSATSTGNHIPKKILERLKEQMRGRGLLASTFFVVLATPELVQAGETGGTQGVVNQVGVLGNEFVDGTVTSATVGMGTVTAVTLTGGTVTVGGAAVTTVVGATGVGAAVVVTAVGGYELGSYISTSTGFDEWVGDGIGPMLGDSGPPTPAVVMPAQGSVTIHGHAGAYVDRDIQVQPSGASHYQNTYRNGGYRPR